MKPLVEVNRKEVFADSSLVARKFGMKHQEVVRMIERTLDDYPDLREVSNLPKTSEQFYTEEREYRKQPYTAYMMNRPFFSLVAMRFVTKKAREWQRKFNNAFYELEHQVLLAENNRNNTCWVVQRNQTKSIRRNETNTIKKFTDYATAQGSRNANRYYSLLTNATYRALGLIQHGSPKLRDTLDVLELSWLMAAESLARSLLKQYMAQNIQYKDIYRMVANELTLFAEPLALMVIGHDKQHHQPENDCSN